MKKLMIAACAVAFAVVAQAAKFEWSNTVGISQAGTVTTENPGGTMYTSGTIYLIDAVTYSQSTLFAAIKAGGDVATLAAANAYNTGTLSNAKKFATATTGTLSSGKVLWTVPEDKYTVGQDYAFYSVLVDGDNFVIDNTVCSVTDTGNSYIQFSNDGSRSQNLPLDVAGGYKGSGWYTVPEPTSGLLLLLGVAGLALRRRRA